MNLPERTHKWNIVSAKGFTLIKTAKANFVSAKGFTLIELLIVISIIGLLAGIITTSFTGAQRQSRDTKRKSDLKLYKDTLQAYASKTGGFYPEYSGGIELTAAANPLCTELLSVLSDIACPVDPLDDPESESNQVYSYQSDLVSGTNGGPTATRYQLSVPLEEGSDWVVCSNGSVGSGVTCSLE